MTATAAQIPSIETLGQPRLYRRLRIWSALGILLTGLVIGGIFARLLYLNQKNATRNEIYYQAELHTMALESEVSRLVGIARQITSRSRIRQELERYNWGEVDKAALVAFTKPKLEDPMRLIPVLRGISRLDQEQDLLLEVGEPIPRSLWPADIGAETPILGVPRLIAGDGRLVVSAPIMDRNEERVGTDIVLFDDMGLRELMAGYHQRHGHVRSVILAKLSDDGIDPFMVYGSSPEAYLPPSLLVSEAMKSLIGGDRIGLHRIPGPQPGELNILHNPVGDSGWVFLVIGDEAALFGDAIRLSIVTALSILALTLIGAYMTFMFTGLLTKELGRQTGNLVDLLNDNQALLEEVRNSKALVQSLLDNTPSVIYVKDLQGRYKMVNAAYRRFSRLSPEQILGKTDHELFPTGIADMFRRNDLLVIEADRALEMDEKVHHEDGVHEYLSVKFPLHDREDKVNAVCGISTDITDRKAAENRLRQSATVFESSGEGLVITRNNGNIVDVNPAFTRIMGYAREELLGANPRLWKSDQHPQDFYDDMWARIKAGGQWRGEIWNRRKDGSLIPVLLTINAVLDAKGDIHNYVAVYSDISIIKQSQAELEYLAHHDVLTDLPNRVLFNARLVHAVERAERTGSTLAVIFLDLDHFKHINDSLGHNAGDQLLTQTAELLRFQLRRDDTVARIGGDEFTFLLEDVPDTEGVILVVEKILRAFDREFQLAEHRLRITASLGISIYPQDGKDAETLLRNADSAMYRAKAEGRNTYQFYTAALTAHALEHMRLEHGLREAIERHELELHYQPQIDLGSGGIVGMEVLMRWQHPEIGMVPPDKFIPIAEDSGLINALDQWAMETAFRQTKRWLDEDLPIGTVAVNISGKHISQGGLSERVAALLSELELPAEHVEIELTESFIMGRSKRDIEELFKLRELGVTLAVDDFGTGYSSLSYLKTLPINRLKIDKSFIQDIPQDANDVAITEAIVALGGSLRLELVAEGIETPQQRDFLIGIGCGLGQGYLFSRPVPAEGMRELLRAAAAGQRRPSERDLPLRIPPRSTRRH